MRNSFWRRLRTGALCFGALLASMALLPASVSAHDIPARVAVLVFIKPDGQTLQVVVRAPLEAMRDVIWPLRGPGYLELGPSAPLARDAARLWIADYLHLFENGDAIGPPKIAASRISLPSDRAFTSYASALAQTTGPALADNIDLAWQQAMIDVVLEYPIASAASRFSIEPSLARLGVRTTTVLRFLPEGGGERVLQYSGNPGLVHLDPSWRQAAGRFVALGFEHILDGIDHLLFLLCLVIPVRRLRPLVAIVTAFTVAHSITLIASASGFAPSALWFPPLIEVLIALSIVYMAFENIVGAKIERRWMIAFAFGLVHGFGFSFALRESLQFAGSHLLTSLLTFNVGVELGQLFALMIALPLLRLFYRYVVAERMGVILLSALVAHTAWHWMTERGAELMQYQLQWPALDSAFAVQVMRALIFLLVIGGAVWLLDGLLGRMSRPQPERDSTVPER